MKIINFGIIGTSAITKRFIKGATFVEGVEVCAICSRSLQQATQYASVYTNMRAYDDIDVFLQDESLDAVYIATPNFTHKELICKVLLAKKHVICEKPMVLSEADVHTCFAIAKQQGCILMEAMKPCFLPTTIQAQTWIQEGKIGRLQYIEAGYCSNGVAPFLNGWHSESKKGGGALFDLGVYPIGFANAIHKKAITNIQATSRCLINGIDAMWAIQLQYEDGVIAQLRCAVDTPTLNIARLYGDQGYIEIENFWKSETATLHTDGQVISFYEPHEQSEFRYQIAAFETAIRNHLEQQPIMNEQASARSAWIVEQIRKNGGGTDEL